MIDDVALESASDTAFETLRLERPVPTEGGPHPGIRILTLSRPERLNAMNRRLVDEVHGALEVLADDPDSRVVILTGEGRGFCAGLDLQGIDSDDAPDTGESGRPRPRQGRVQAGMAFQERIASLVPAMRRLPVPVIAAVNGAAAGGGLALALASDVRIAARSGRFNVAFVRIGLSGCDIGVSWMLPRWIGASLAYELMLTGRMVESDEAARIGLVSRVVADEDLMSEALVTAELICANSPFGVRMTKEVMWSNLETSSLRAAIDLENRTQILSSFTADSTEAVTAFLERRTPDFENR